MLTVTVGSGFTGTQQYVLASGWSKQSIFIFRFLAFKRVWDFILEFAQCGCRQLGEIFSPQFTGKSGARGWGYSPADSHLRRLQWYYDFGGFLRGPGYLCDHQQRGKCYISARSSLSCTPTVSNSRTKWQHLFFWFLIPDDNALGRFQLQSLG